MSYRDDILALSPIAYWRLGEPSGTTANDEIEVSDGTYVSSPTLGTAALIGSDADTAVELNGTSHATFPLSAQFGNHAEVTLAAWIKTDTVTLPNGHRMFLTFGGSTYLSITGSGTGTIFCSMSINGAQKVVSSGVPATIGDTYFVVVTYDGSALRIYVNGELQGTTSSLSGNAILGLSGTGYIGAYIISGWGWDGVLDEVAVFDTALSDSEIEALYNTAFEPGLDPGQYTVIFTPSDDISVGADELSYEVRTATAGGGTLLASGTATSSIEVTTDAIDDAALVNGANTRYLRIVDGAGNPFDTSFTVDATGFSQPTEVVVTIVGTSAVNAGLTAPAQIVVNSVGQATVVNVLIAPGPALFTLNAAGSATVEAGLQATAGIAEVNAASSATVSATLSRPERITASIAGASSVTAVLTTPAQIAASADGGATVDASLQTGLALPVNISGTSSLSAGLTAPARISASIAGTSSVALILAIPAIIEAEAAGQASAQVTLTTPVQLTASIIGAATTQVRVLQRSTQTGFRLRADIYDTDGVSKIAPLAFVLAAEYGEDLDSVGMFSLEIPAIDPNAVEVVSGREIWLYRDGEGLLFKGIVKSRETLVDASGNLTLAIACDSIARELVWANTLLGREFSNTAMSSVVSTLLTGTGWSANNVENDTRNLTAQYEGASIWAALLHAAEIFGWHVRERNLSRMIDVGSLGGDSGLVMRNVEQVAGDMGVLPITGLTLREQQDELWTRVLPVGGGDGINATTLRYSDRTSPYTIQSDTGPDGETYYYIEDSAAALAHGTRVKVLSVQDVVPLANSSAEFKHAANALYDIAAAWLGWHSSVQETYEVEVTGLTHIENGAPRFRVGDTARLVYRGVVTDLEGKRLWRSVDDDLWIMGYRRQFNADGSDSWSFTVSTTDRETLSDADTISRALEDLWAVKTAKQPYTYREPHGPSVMSIDGTHDARFLVDFDANVTYLRQALLRVRKRQVKANVSGAAAGGGQTSSAGGGQTTSGGGGQSSSSEGSHSHSVSSDTTSSGGGQTSTFSGSHSHTVPGQTIFFSGDHFHQWGEAQPTVSSGTPVWQQQIQTERSNGSSFGFDVIRGASDASTNGLYTMTPGAHVHSIDSETTDTESSHSHSVSDHSHSVSGQTAASGGSHSHDIDDHTHSVNDHTHETDDHTHSLVYGIFEGPTASSPNLRVTINGTDRTLALGGPWDDDFLVDITAYLTDAVGQVLRQANNIDISGDQLCDVEVTCKSLVTATSVVPV